MPYLMLFALYVAMLRNSFSENLRLFFQSMKLGWESQQEWCGKLLKVCADWRLIGALYKITLKVCQAPRAYKTLDRSSNKRTEWLTDFFCH